MTPVSTSSHDSSDVGNSKPEGSIRFEDLLGKVSAKFLSLVPGDIDEAFLWTLGLVGGCLGASGAGILRLSDDKEHFSLSHAWHLKDTPRFHIPPGRLISVKDFPWLTEYLLSGGAVLNSKISELPEDAVSEREFCLKAGIKSFVAIPVVHKGNSMGAVGFYATEKKHEWPAEILKQLPLLGEILANAEERRQEHTKLLDSEQRLKAVISALPGTLFLFDREGRFKEVITSYDLPVPKGTWGLKGRLMHEIFPDGVADRLLRVIHRTIETHESQIVLYELEIDGKKRWYEGRTSYLEDKKTGNENVMWLAYNVTAHKRSDKMRSFQDDLALVSAAGKEWDVILHYALKAAISISEMDCGGIYLVDDSTGGFELAFSVGFSEEFLNRVRRYNAESPFAQMVMQGIPIFNENGAFGHPFDAIRSAEGLLAVAIIPVLHDGRVIGSLNIGSRALGEIPSYTRGALETFAAHIGNAICHIKADESRRDKERLLSSTFRAAPVGVGLVSNRVVMDVNDRLCEMLGYSREELVGKSTYEFYPSREDFDHVGKNHYEQIRTEGRGDIETRLRRKDGSIMDVLICSAPLDPDSRDSSITFTVLDITDRTNATREIRERLRLEELLSEISTKFINLPISRFGKEMQESLRTVGEFFKADRCSLIMISDDGKRLTPSYVWLSDAVGKSQNVYPIEYSDAIIEKWRTGEPVVGDLLSELPRDLGLASGILKEAGWKSSATVPLKAGKDLLGAFGISSLTREKVWSEEMVKRLQLIGECFANALLRMQAEEELREAFSRIRELKNRLESENVYLRKELNNQSESDGFIGQSDVIKKALEQVERVANADTTVLLQGETGTGKGILARRIHKLSPRKDHAMVEVNCATLPAALAESELFGHEKGAFTGAHSRHVGRFEVADGSTILLDEVGELSPELQAKLLRVLQDGEFEKLGSTKTINVDVRVIAASNRDLALDVKEGRFRGDLYYRLNVFPIYVPPLRERQDDIPLLVWEFVKEFGALMGKDIRTIPRSSMEALKSHPWPGNVRELRNVIERAMIISDGSVLRIEIPGLYASGIHRSATLREVERDHILSVLEKAGWRVRGKNGAAEILGIKPTTLYSRMEKLGIKRPTSSVDI
jgi:formate hydrogenlyase transcriptional activator